MSNSPGFTHYFLSCVRLRNTSELWLTWIEIYFHSSLCSFMPRAHPQLVSNQKKKTVCEQPDWAGPSPSKTLEPTRSCCSRGGKSSDLVLPVFATIFPTGGSPKISFNKCNYLPTLISPGSGLYSQQILKINPLIVYLLLVVYCSWQSILHALQDANLVLPAYLKGK